MITALVFSVVVLQKAMLTIGRISKCCLGLYNDKNEKALGTLLSGIKTPIILC
tara:strand:+ start:289 stop:447 length:159 start_codon:yes stop_codon:yes gene_type:complete